MTIGVAAHICAASPGGPRYDASQDQKARRGRDNGIWLCQTCAKLIDSDPRKFTVELLTKWKKSAQERAFRELVAPENSTKVDEAERVEAIVAAENRTVADGAFQFVFDKVHAAAGADLAGYKRGPMWSKAQVELTLRPFDDQEAAPFKISKLPAGLDVSPEVTIVAPPGTGKTTTVLQLATYVLAGKRTVLLYFRLGDWSAGSLGLLPGLHQRAAFKDIRPDDLVEVAKRGRLLLVLDGWNELDPDSRKRLRVELDQIRRDWPFVRVVATTRRQALDVPISGPRIAIEPLSEDQQMGIAESQFGDAGKKVVDSAWRTPGVRGLIATPLYLSALLSVGSKGASPKTKEEVLRLFVEQHDLEDEHAEALQAILHGCHPQVLTALACQMNTSGSTAMADVDARRLVSITISKLRDEGQLDGPVEPLTVLEALASHHTLVRSGTGNGSISFQHQQFQEWFASHRVAELMRASAEGDMDARGQLRVAVLDQAAWEESVLFAVERMSREEGGTGVVAHTVRLALPIDPMLAAEMIYRSNAAVWKDVEEEIVAFVDRWHRPETVDRAVRFMVVTGRPEFQARLWPLVSSADSRIRLPALRAAPRFRPSALGSDIQTKIAALPEETRESILGEIAYKSGVDGMELATELAKTDPSPRVQAAVVQYLQFRRADRHVVDLLQSARDETWALVAERGYAEDISDPTAISRLRAERDKALAKATGPAERLRLLIEQPAGHPGRDADIAAAVADPNFPIRDQQASTSLHLAQEHAGAAVIEGVRQRVENGLEVPHHAEGLLASLGVIDDGPVAARILDDREVGIVVILAGPKTVVALVDKFLACAKGLKAARNDEGLNDTYQRLSDRIAATRGTSFINAIKARGNTDDVQIISALATLIAHHGGHDDRATRLPIEPNDRRLIIDMMRKWVEAVVSSPDARRYEICVVGNAIGRIGFPELLPDLRRLLDEDLARLKKARDGFREAQRRGDIGATSDAGMRYGNQYREAFASIGGSDAANILAAYLEDRAFGFEAAVALKAISDELLNVPKPNVHRQWPRFEEVAAARAKRASGSEEPPADTLAQPIFAAIDRLARPETDTEGQLLAIQMARIGLALPHSNQNALIERVMALPQPLRTKLELLAAKVLDDQVLDAALVMQAVDEWLAEASRNEQTAWHKRQNTWEIEPWLELLPFTTQPETLFSGLEKVKAFYGSRWPQRWQRVLTAAACVPGAGGEALLAKLARFHKDIADDYEWMKPSSAVIAPRPC